MRTDAGRKRQEEARRRLAAAHDKPATPRAERKLESKGHAWRFDPGLERLIAMRSSDPARFAKAITPELRIRLGLYSEQKAIAASIGLDTSDPEGGDGE